MEDKAIQALTREWGLILTGSISREELLARLADRISQLLAGSGESFFQLMYRLDIPEQKLAGALAAADPPAAIALLIWERQLEKLASRARYSRPPDPGDELAW